MATKALGIQQESALVREVFDRIDAWIYQQNHWSARQALKERFPLGGVDESHFKALAKNCLGEVIWDIVVVDARRPMSFVEVTITGDSKKRYLASRPRAAYTAATDAFTAARQCAPRAALTERRSSPAQGGRNSGGASAILSSETVRQSGGAADPTARQNCAGAAARQGGSDALAEAGGHLSGVVAWLVDLPSEQAPTVQQSILAFGGRVSAGAEGATHAIVSDVATGGFTERLKLFSSQNKFRVVRVRWLQHLLETMASPLDNNFAAAHVPDLLLFSAASENARKVEAAPFRSTSKPRTRLQGKSPRPVHPGHYSSFSDDEQQAAQPCSAKRSRTASVSPVGVAACVGSPLAPRPPLAEAAATLTVQSYVRPLAHIGASLLETMGYLRREWPDEVEAGQLRLAIQRSLLDSAVLLHVAQVSHAVAERPPNEVLGVSANASVTEIRSAYRALALAAHPDKGGDPSEFCRVQRAYLALTAERKRRGEDVTRPSDEAAAEEVQLALPAAGGVCRDFQLKNHRDLVRKKFEQDGVDLSKCQARQSEALLALGLEAVDVGSVNRNERDEVIYNQCFYLSLARSYMEDASLLKETALSLKRVVEGAVLSEHPDWAGERVGEDVQAFSDFLVFVLGGHALLSELAVAIFDDASGCVELYVGRCFPGRAQQEEQRANLLTIQYVPGHYKALVHSNKRQTSRPTFRELRDALDRHNVHYVVTYV